MKKKPDSEGYWWMNDTSAYGWEAVRIEKTSNGFVVRRTGVHNAEEVPSYVKEWVKIPVPFVGEVKS